jgi:hypothetical protein
MLSNETNREINKLPHPYAPDLQKQKKRHARKCYFLNIKYVKFSYKFTVATQSSPYLGNKTVLSKGQIVKSKPQFTVDFAGEFSLS